MSDDRAQRRHRDQDSPWLTPGRLASLIVVLLAAYATLVVVRALRPLLVMLLVSVFLSFAVEPAVQSLAGRGWRRGPATAFVFAMVLLFVVGFFAAMSPLLVSQVEDLIRNVPRIVDRVASLLAELPLPFDVETSAEARSELTALTVELRQRLQGAAFGAAGRVVDLGATALASLLQVFTILLVAFYLVSDGPRARRILFSPFPPRRQRELLAIWELAVAKTGGYIYSRLLLAGISAVATGLFFVVLRLPSAVPLAAWVGVTSAFIPVVGTYLGGLLPIVVAVASPRPSTALWILAFIVVYQQVENYVLAPRIQSHTMEIHPAIAFVSVLAGGYLLGAAGALLALPAAAIIQALLSTYVSRHDLIHELHDDFPAARISLEEAAGTGPPDPREHGHDRGHGQDDEATGAGPSGPSGAAGQPQDPHAATATDRREDSQEHV